MMANYLHAFGQQDMLQEATFYLFVRKGASPGALGICRRQKGIKGDNGISLLQDTLLKFSVSKAS